MCYINSSCIHIYLRQICLRFNGLESYVEKEFDIRQKKDDLLKKRERLVNAMISIADMLDTPIDLPRCVILNRNLLRLVSSTKF